MRAFNIVFLTSCMVSCDFSNAGSVGGFGGSLEVTQIAQMAQDVDNTLREVEKVQRLISQARQRYQNLQRNTEGWKQMDWSKTTNHITRLRELMGESQGFVYTGRSIEAEFSRKMKGYDTYVEHKTLMPPFRHRYQHWEKAKKDSVKATLRTVDLQENQFESEEKTLKTLENMGLTAKGRMQALQVSHKLAAEEVRQLQKLRHLVLSQMKAQTAYQASEADQKAFQQAARENFFKSTNLDVNNGKVY